LICESRLGELDAARLADDGVLNAHSNYSVHGLVSRDALCGRASTSVCAATRFKSQTTLGFSCLGLGPC
jgi:hypothetical protein